MTFGWVKGLTASLWTGGAVAPDFGWAFVSVGLAASAANPGEATRRTRADRRSVLMTTS
jgi:hypothetical protein